MTTLDLLVPPPRYSYRKFVSAVIHVRTQASLTHASTHSRMHKHTLVWRPSGLCPGLPGPRWAGTRTNLDLTEATDSERQGHQLGNVQICTSSQTDNHATTPPLSFYRPGALTAAQPTASKHWRHRNFLYFAITHPPPSHAVSEYYFC